MLLIIWLKIWLCGIAKICFFYDDYTNIQLTFSV